MYDELQRSLTSNVMDLKQPISMLGSSGDHRLVAGLVFPTRPPKQGTRFEANAHLAREKDDIELGVAGEVVVVNIRDHLGLKTSASMAHLKWDSAFAKSVPGGDGDATKANGSKGSNYAEHAARRKSVAPERSASSKLVEEKAVEESAIEHAVQLNARPLIVDMSENNGITLAASAQGSDLRLLDVLRRSDLKIDPHVMMDSIKDGVGMGSTGELKRVVCGAVDPDGTRVMLCRADDTIVLINTVTGHIRSHKVRRV